MKLRVRLHIREVLGRKQNQKHLEDEAEGPLAQRVKCFLLTGRLYWLSPLFGS